MRMKLRDMPIEYAASSMSPKGEASRTASGGIFASMGVVDTRALKARPVDADANNPQGMPKPGINIGNPIEALCANIPIASIPCTVGIL